MPTSVQEEEDDMEEKRLELSAEEYTVAELIEQLKEDDSWESDSGRRATAVRTLLTRILPSA